GKCPLFAGFLSFPLSPKGCPPAQRRQRFRWHCQSMVGNQLYPQRNTKSPNKGSDTAPQKQQSVPHKKLAFFTDTFLL
ncbi:MAG: hypothetical protein J1F09_09665, partial [Oscillospiraceae bacterium]|nr:hypothetical protein [Oscillospiraceae bacterium]